ncbi:MAG: hypothetical protein JEZ07_14725 [Phycisphaerae bacterium]|nr:hypothetical protein [Phycisphaerae bacterium]
MFRGELRVIIGLIVLFVGEINAGLNYPAVINSSFEDPVLAPEGKIDGVIDWFDSSAYTYTQDDGLAAIPETPYGDNWAEMGNERWVYQQIGTYQENMDIDISFLLGQRSDKPFQGVHVSLLVGGNPASAEDKDLKYYVENPLVTQVGAVEIANSGAINPFPTTASGTSEQALTVSTGTGYAIGAPLWIQFNKVSGTGRVLLDNVVVSLQSVLPTAIDPVPSVNADMIDPGGQLSWDVENVVDPSFDINIGTTIACNEIVDGVSVGANKTYMPTSLNYDETYYWRVDVTDGGNEYIGSVWQFSTGGRAINPVPAKDAIVATNLSELSWGGYLYVDSYNVYFGPEGSMTFLGNYTATQAVVSGVTAETQYQWKVDSLDVNGAVLVAGDTWSFYVPAIAPLVIDDFTGYNDNAALQSRWTTNANIMLYDLYGSMVLTYDNTGLSNTSQAAIEFATPMTFLGSHSVLSISFTGLASNSEEQIAVVIVDNDSQATIQYSGGNSTISDTWWDWQIPLADIAEAGIDLTKITRMAIEIGDSHVVGGSGAIAIDDIELEYVKPPLSIGDINADRTVDILDLQAVMSDWLFSDYEVEAWEIQSVLQAGYTFEETSGVIVTDISGNGNNGTITPNGSVDYWQNDGAEGSDGSLKLTGDIEIILPAEVFADVSNAMTLAMWVKMPAEDFERAEFSLGKDSHVYNSWEFIRYNVVDDLDQWQHVAVAVDANSRLMQIYHNGVLVQQRIADKIEGSPTGQTVINLDTAESWVMIDNLAVFNTLLSPNEIVYLAKGSGGSVVQPIRPIFSNVDISADGKININDFAIIASQWLIK